MTAAASLLELAGGAEFDEARTICFALFGLLERSLSTRVGGGVGGLPRTICAVGVAPRRGFGVGDSGTGYWVWKVVVRFVGFVAVIPVAGVTLSERNWPVVGLY